MKLSRQQILAALKTYTPHPDFRIIITIPFTGVKFHDWRLILVYLVASQLQQN